MDENADAGYCSGAFKSAVTTSYTHRSGRKSSHLSCMRSPVGCTKHFGGAGGGAVAGWFGFATRRNDLALSLRKVSRMGMITNYMMVGVAGAAGGAACSFSAETHVLMADVSTKLSQTLL
jgi:hypothetical protein